MGEDGTAAGGTGGVAAITGERALTSSARSVCSISRWHAASLASSCRVLASCASMGERACALRAPVAGDLLRALARGALAGDVGIAGESEWVACWLRRTTRLVPAFALPVPAGVLRLRAGALRTTAAATGASVFERAFLDRAIVLLSASNDLSTAALFPSAAIAAESEALS